MFAQYDNVMEVQNFILIFNNLNEYHLKTHHAELKTSVYISDFNIINVKNT